MADINDDTAVLDMDTMDESYAHDKESSSRPLPLADSSFQSQEDALPILGAPFMANSMTHATAGGVLLALPPPAAATVGAGAFLLAPPSAATTPLIPDAEDFVMGKLYEAAEEQDKHESGSGSGNGSGIADVTGEHAASTVSAAPASTASSAPPATAIDALAAAAAAAAPEPPKKKADVAVVVGIDPKKTAIVVSPAPVRIADSPRSVGELRLAAEAVPPRSPLVRAALEAAAKGTASPQGAETPSGRRRRVKVSGGSATAAPVVVAAAAASPLTAVLAAIPAVAPPLVSPIALRTALTSSPLAAAPLAPAPHGGKTPRKTLPPTAPAPAPATTPAPAPAPAPAASRDDDAVPSEDEQEEDQEQEDPSDSDYSEAPTPDAPAPVELTVHCSRCHEDVPATEMPAHAARHRAQKVAREERKKERRRQHAEEAEAAASPEPSEKIRARMPIKDITDPFKRTWVKEIGSFRRLIKTLYGHYKAWESLCDSVPAAKRDEAVEERDRVAEAHAAAVTSFEWLRQRADVATSGRPTKYMDLQSGELPAQTEGEQSEPEVPRRRRASAVRPKVATPAPSPAAVAAAPVVTALSSSPPRVSFAGVPPDPSETVGIAQMAGLAQALLQSPDFVQSLIRQSGLVPALAAGSVPGFAPALAPAPGFAPALAAAPVIKKKKKTATSAARPFGEDITEDDSDGTDSDKETRRRSHAHRSHRARDESEEEHVVAAAAAAPKKKRSRAEETDEDSGSSEPEAPKPRKSALKKPRHEDDHGAKSDVVAIKKEKKKAKGSRRG